MRLDFRDGQKHTSCHQLATKKPCTVWLATSHGIGFCHPFKQWHSLVAHKCPTSDSKITGLTPVLCIILMCA